MLGGLLKVLRWKNEKAEVKISEPVEVEQKPKSRGQGNWKTKKYSLVKNKGKRCRFYYRFNENESLEYICAAYKSEEKELVKHIENLINKGYDKKEIKAKMANRFNERRRNKKTRKNSTRTGKISEPVEVEQKPKSRGQGNWKTKKYSLVKNKGKRCRFYYRFNENESLEYICGAYKSEEKELVKHIENLISKGYDKKEIKAKMANRFNERRRNKKTRKNSTRTGKMNEALSWDKDGILLYHNKKTNITPSILRMFCTFHSNCNSNYDLIDLINQQYKNEDLLGSAVSYICINYNSLNLQKLIKEGAKIE